MKIQYIASHKGATLPAAPAMGKLPPDLHTRLSGGEFKRTYYVKVSKALCKVPIERPALTRLDFQAFHPFGPT